MISTLFAQDALDTTAALVVAAVVGFLFGLVLEQAGFGSSRRLAGIFYFRDMTVLRVMFTGLLTAAIGLGYLFALGVLDPQAGVFLLPTVYGAQIVGGLLFGVGFAVGGWCPGTAAVGLASGRVDAALFLVGAIAGSVLYNELFPVLRPLASLQDRGVCFAYDAAGVSRAAFTVGLAVVAVVCFWVTEWVEMRLAPAGGRFLRGPFLRVFSGLVLASALLLCLVAERPVPGSIPAREPVQDVRETTLMQQVELGADHMAPEELADRLMQADPDLLVVDLRPAAEFASCHIRGAINVSLPDLATVLVPYRGHGTIVLYSNGMTHPAQARDSLARSGYQNVLILTDGLQGFAEHCLKPVSLRDEPPSVQAAATINAWRAFFLAAPAASPDATRVQAPREPLPGLVRTPWLGENLGRDGLRVLDCRPVPEYSAGHIPGSLGINPESFRGPVGGVPASLLPARLIAAHLSLMGVQAADLLVIVPGEKLHDATLAAIALARVGHRRFAILDGGFAQWLAEKRPVDTRLPVVIPAVYEPEADDADTFAVDASQVLAYSREPGVTILDVRPSEYYSGQKSDETRAGHIPGARSRPISEDVVKTNDGITRLRDVEELRQIYAGLIPASESPVVVHCRTGHQASQTVFVLKYLLGYPQVKWYGAGWTEWAARPELPVVLRDAR